MFFWCGHILQAVETDCWVASIPVDEETPLFAPHLPIDERARTKALRRLRPVEQEFRNVGLHITADTVKEVMETLHKRSISQTFQWLMDQVKAIHRLADKELKGKLFFCVPAERVRFLPLVTAPHVFGSAVADAFPSANYDVSEAGTCLGLARGAACVFHLMRVLEIGLSVLGKEFGVSLAHTNWAPAIEELESKIREMHKDPRRKALPDCKEQQEFYAQAASHFGILKDAWRNYTMHARGNYTEEQAERIFENVKAFMQQLSQRLHE